MEATSLSIFRDQLTDRRRRLEHAPPAARRSADVQRLLSEVDAALRRIDVGEFGLCETCHDAIEPDRLIADPLTRFCLDHLTALEQQALQRDLDLAARIQRELLPKPDVSLDGWEIAYHYQPAGPVSGDYCDLLRGSDGRVYLLVGDVAGKGVAAAMVMSHLSAMLRTLISTGMPLNELIERASRVLCESTLPTHYATLVCVCASPDGNIEVCNAGHPPPLVVGRSGTTELPATNLPVGMFCAERFTTATLRLDEGDTLLLYTDGYIEAANDAAEEYGRARVAAMATRSGSATPRGLVDACVADLWTFRGAQPCADDVTILSARFARRQ